VTPRPRIAPMIRPPQPVLVGRLVRWCRWYHPGAWMCALRPSRGWGPAGRGASMARRVPMTAPAVPPLISSDGHLEVRPERWSPRMPAKYRDQAPRTIKLPDGGDAILVEGQPPYPAPFLDLRAGRPNETWPRLGVTVDDTAGVGPPEQRLREQDMDLLHAEVLFPNMQVGPRLWRTIKDEDVYRATVRAYNDWLGEEYCAASRD